MPLGTPSPVVASEKGIVVGRLTFRDDGVDQTPHGGGRGPLPPVLRPLRLGRFARFTRQAT